jgi:hypothetical protein
LLADARLLALLVPAAGRGQLAFANGLRRLVFRAAPNAFELLEFDDDDAFLEPTVFPSLLRGAADSDELLAGYVGAIAEPDRPQSIRVCTDGSGRLFLPRLGYLEGLPPLTLLELRRDDSSPVGYVAGRTAEETQLSDWTIGEKRIALLPYPVSALTLAVGNELPAHEQAAREHRPALASALVQLEEVWAELAAAINDVVRYVILFEDESRNSFATVAAHGAVFLNVAHGTSDVYLLEDLAHQCGHVIFAAGCEGEPALFAVTPSTPVSELTGEEDHRSIEVALHGMVTQALMVALLDRSLTSGRTTARDEVRGRLLFALLRLGTDLRCLAGLPAYGEAGEAIVRELIGVYGSAVERYGDQLLAADFTGQPYNFDFVVYAARNPVRELATR